MCGAALSFCVLASCNTRAPAGRQMDAGTSAVDARADAHEAGGVMVVDAAAPDDAVLPRSSDDLAVRARHLLEAIAQDDTALASDILFPRDAWLSTHDAAADPGKDWDVHVATPFRRAVHALSRRQRSLDQVQVVSIELGSAMAQATTSRHGWKKPLWTLTGSRLTFVVDGHTRTLPIREMVAWRGDWYVTRLR